VIPRGAAPGARFRTPPLACLLSLLPALALARTSTAAAPAAPPQVPERVSFAEAMRRAGLQATSAAVALEEVRRAQALLVEARSLSLPLLSGNASLTLLDRDRVQPGSGAVLAPRDQRNANLALQVPLLAPSRWASWAVASEQVEVARASEQDVRRAVLITAARSYLSVLAQRRVVEVSRSARDIAAVRFDFARARRAGGIGNAIDEARAEQQLAASEAQLRNGEVGLLRAQEALGAATGSDAALDAAEEPAFEPEGSPADPEARRADVRAARERLEGIAQARRLSWTDWLPTLLASGQAFANDPSTATNPQTGWQVVFVLSLPIFEGGLRVGQLREREALEREARILLESTLRLVHSDVRLATQSLSRQEEALASSRLAAGQARNVLDLTTESYKAGATNDLDVSTAQQQSRDADLQVVIAEDAVRQARLDLLSAFGQFP
jgi:outer membrane protein TolC